MASESAVVKALNRLRRRLEAVERGQRYAHGGSIENAALEVKDDTGSLRAIVGQQADGTTGVNVTNGPIPPQPSPPVVEPALAALAVTWDGTFDGAVAGPLDWMRCEVHIGPDSLYTPDQSTLRDTIESPQGGTVTIPLPYTQWSVKLRSRSTSGVSSTATAAVAGTPRKAETADLTAGIITADLIAVDALTGKTITGGTVTGSIVQTASSGQRIVLNPTASDPDPDAAPGATVAGAEIHSGSVDQITPGVLVANVDTDVLATPYAGLFAPSLKRDSQYAYPLTARLLLRSPQTGSRGGSFTLEGNTALGSADQAIGNIRMYGYTADTSLGESHLELECLSGVDAVGGNGTTLGPRSHLTMDGSQARLRAVTATQDVSVYVKPTAVEVTGGPLTAPNIRAGRTQAPAPGASPGQTSVVVAFSSAMTGTPRVTATPDSSATNLNSTNIRWTIKDVTTTGFTLNCWRDTNFGTNFDYIAVSNT